MRNVIILTVLLASVLLTAAEIKILQADKIGTTPVIDGSLREACWKKAETAGDFVLNVSGGSPAKMQTSFSVLYDQNNLYFGIECQEERMNELKKDCVKHDGAVYADDCLEIFIDTNIDRQTYFHFMVNPAAIKAEWNYKNKNWNPPWQTRVEEKEKSWTIEIVIPLSELGIKETDGALLRFNVCRARRPGALEYSCWSNTEGSFHAPGRFGWLTLGKYDGVIQRNFFPTIRKKSENYKKLLLNKGKVGKKLQSELDNICAPFRQLERMIASGKQATVEDFIKMQHTVASLENFEYEISLNLLFYKEERKIKK
jgi:cellulose/xylan binding protein with CBM9 domain